MQTHAEWYTHAAYVHGPSTHVAPFMHGEELHSWIVVQEAPWSDVS